MKRIALFWALTFSWTGLFAQWSDNSKENLQLIDQSYYTFETGILSDGSWYLYYNRPENGIDTVVPYLQRFDANGVSLWDERVEVSKQPTLSYTKYMNALLVDNEDNAIIGVQDIRHGVESYTAYKISPDGISLWPNGVDLHSGLYPEGCAALSMIQIADGSYIFAWQEFGANSSGTIRMQRVSAEGNCLWGEGKVLETLNVPYTYPYLVDAGNNEFILVYAYGASEELQVRKMDFDGNDVWAEPTVGFSGTMGSSPLWTYLNVVPAAGGVLIGTYAGDPNYPYCVYVRKDGTHAFVEADAGLRLGYSEWLAWGIKLVYDEENQTIYAAWRETDFSQGFQRIVTQKISMAGELLWDPNGVEIAAFLPRPVSYYDAEIGPKGSLFISYMEQYDSDGNGGGSNDPVKALAVLQGTEGDFIWEDTAVVISDTASIKYGLTSLPLSDDQWILVWEDVRDVEGVDGGYLYGQNVNVNGLLGEKVEPSANESRRETHAATFHVKPNPIRDHAVFHIENPRYSGQLFRIEMMNANGAIMGEICRGSLHEGRNIIEWNRPMDMPGGFYLLKATVGDRTQFAKIILR